MVDQELFQSDLFSTFDQHLIEDQIKTNQKDFDFDIREYTVDFLVQQFNPNPDGNSDIFIPEYQRDDVWSDKQKSLFIESLLIGLPIPYIFVADVDDSELDDADGRIEIIDGAQRTRTIYQFRKNKLKLCNMERLPSLEGARYSDLPIARQRRFNRTTVRLIELKNINEDGRRLMFDRLNTGGSPLTEMEKRLGTESGRFIEFLRRLASDENFVRLTPMPSKKETRRERAEYVLRFFAYRENYENFEKSVRDFLNDYLDEKSKYFNEAEEIRLEKMFNNMLDFIEVNFRFQFRKGERASNVSRIRFEATAVGCSLALEQNPAISSYSSTDTSWAYKEPFLSMMRSDASNSKPKVKARIEFVKHKLLGLDTDVLTEYN
ncbi:DUF262 domain-containing protein [Acinetobacter sp. SWAC5]|uniref:DUF262 domain-containing protein n=1 Tax=Acinetobacter sp. SWAC5 TaxID=2293835 RepID=UPI000E35281C|nr:DUF262 domain-containing protein [Acinetobacter sp. SWAC5]RFS32176.1 DUF262 domain-containing protein [Acinetobacter sp. SWAC5]